MFDRDQFLSSGTLMMIKDHRLLIGTGQRTWMESPTNPSQPTFYFPDFFLNKQRPWFQHEHCFEFSVQEFYDLLNHTHSTLKSPEWLAPTPDQYQWGFKALQNMFQSKELQKGVPYVFEKSASLMDRKRLLNSISSLLRFALDRPILPYGFWSEEEGVLGASPELLFRLEPGQLTTMACAGTMGHHESLESFKKDPKELEEHRCVIQGITDSLTPFGEVQRGELQLLDLGKLVHLVTPIAMKLPKSPNYAALIEALHPTPALGTFPKQAGKQWLCDYEKRVPRKRYGAPVGVIHGDEGSFYVGIRNVQWNADGMALGAGGGVNAQSVLDREWNEIHRKLGAIKEVLSLV